MTTAAPTATAASAVGSTGPLQLHHPPGGGSGASSSSLLSSASASDGDDPASDAEAIELKALGCPARRGRAGGDGAESSGVEDGESVVAAGGSTTAAGFRLYTPDEERGVVGKFDRRLVGFVALLYMLGFLDRSSAYFCFVFTSLPRLLVCINDKWETRDRLGGPCVLQVPKPCPLGEALPWPRGARRELDFPLVCFCLLRSVLILPTAAC